MDGKIRCERRWRRGHGGNSQMLGKNSLMDSWNFRINTFILPSETREWLSW